MDSFTNHSQPRTTYGFLDMGGALTQMAFELSLAERNNPENSSIDVRLRLLCGEVSIRHHLVGIRNEPGLGTIRDTCCQRFQVEPLDEP